MKFLYQGFKLSFLAVAAVAVMYGLYVLGDIVFATGSLWYILFFFFSVLGFLFSAVLYWANKSSY